MAEVDWKKIGLFSVRHLIWIINVIIVIVLGFLVPEVWLTTHNFHFILYTSTFLGFGVFAEGIALLSGNFDLSLAQMVGFTGMVTGVLVGSLNFSPVVLGIIGIVVIIGFATFLGAINGVLIGKLGLNAFLVTLATYTVFSWSTLVVRHSVIYKLPSLLLWPGGSKIFGTIWTAIPILLGLVLIINFVLNYTQFGRNIYAVGGDPQTSHMLGINPGNVVFYTYVFVGFLMGISALLWVGYLGSVPTSIANGEIFTFFAGAIIGGVSLRGGRGTIVGMLGGVLFVSITKAGLTYLGLAPAEIGLSFGFLILIAIGIQAAEEKIEDFIESY